MNYSAKHTLKLADREERNAQRGVSKRLLRSHIWRANLSVIVYGKRHASSKRSFLYMEKPSTPGAYNLVYGKP